MPRQATGFFSHEDWASLDLDPCPRCGRPRIDYGGAIIIVGPKSTRPPDLRERLGNPRPDVMVIGMDETCAVDPDHYLWDRPSRMSRGATATGPGAATTPTRAEAEP